MSKRLFKRSAKLVFFLKRVLFFINQIDTEISRTVDCFRFRIGFLPQF